MCVHCMQVPGFKIYYSCADLESFVRGGPPLRKFFLVDDRRKDQNNTKSGTSSAR